MKLAVDRRLIAHLARLVAVAVFCVALGGPAVRAEGGGLGDFFSHLFGVPQPKAPDAPAHRPHKPRVRDFVPATTTREPGTPGGAPVQPTFFIDVVGDSLGVLRPAA